jgi:hypothetical protein
MDPTVDPFSPGAGSQPPALVGRDEVLRSASIALERIRNGRAERSPLMVGLRGVGKTVLLVTIRRMAESKGFKTAFIEAEEKKPLSAMLAPAIRQLLLALRPMNAAGEKITRAYRGLKNFARGFKFEIGEFAFSVDGGAEMGLADSGALEVDLPDLFQALGEAAAESGSAVAIIIDELQYVGEPELAALIKAVHRVSQEGLPLIVIGAGLPQLAGNMGDAKSYAERLFLFPKIGALSRDDAFKALEEPVETRDASFTPAALEEIFRQTQGYPYFLQEWGSHSWRAARQPTIDLPDVQAANASALANLDANFFTVRFDRLSNRERNYLRALAELGSGPQRSGKIAELLGMSSESAGPLRSALIGKGMIYAPQHGETAFTVPLFDAFMKRAMPNLPAPRPVQK